jgi:hypothetical protein
VIGYIKEPWYTLDVAKAAKELKMTAPAATAAPVTLKPAPVTPKPLTPIGVVPAPVEPAGAARFTAVSYPNPPVSGTATQAKVPTFLAGLQDDPEAAMTALEARLTELETVVHGLVPNVQHSGAHSVVSAWFTKMTARIAAGVKKL